MATEITEHELVNEGTNDKAEIHVSAERVIAAAPERVYAYIADHERHHHRFLPTAFSDYRVEEGGIGAGTVVSYRLKAAGRTQAYRARIDEPEPGRVLTETLLDSGAVTTFTILPHADGSLVRIETRWRAARGIKGWVERHSVPRILRPLFTDELARLDAYARSAEVDSGSSAPTPGRA